MIGEIKPYPTYKDSEMTNNTNGQKLYWNGGPFRMLIQLKPRDSTTTSPDSVSTARTTLKDFRDACQWQYIAFYGAINGRSLGYKQFTARMKDRKKMFHVGKGPPVSATEQRPGRSCIASIRVGQLLDGLVKGGDFEAEHAKAVVVMIYSMWEKRYRREVANAMSVKKNQVTCTLMGDIRQVRNCILHTESIIDDHFSEKLVLLQQIWRITSGKLRITEGMLHSLMEQINALQVEIAIQGSHGIIKNDH